MERAPASLPMPPALRRSHRAAAGFSLIEILIVVAIGALIAAALFLSVGALRTTTELEGAVGGTVALLRLAREYTLAAKGNEQWGVHVTPQALLLFSGASYQGVAAETFAFSNVEASASLSGGGSDIVFERIDGTTATNGTITLRSRTGTIRVVTIFVSGEVAVSSALPPALGTRRTDTRHVHLTLPFSLNNAATMTLRFSNPPNADTVQPIDVSSNLENGKFRWEGDVDVNGSRQHLEIVSHAIGVTSTELAVRRDRMENDKALRIDIDGTVIATYTATGEVTGGTGVTVAIE